MYCNIKEIHDNSFNIYKIPYNHIINIHIILKIALKKRLAMPFNFQGFFDKEPIGVFDRVTLSRQEGVVIYLSCRLSKDFKRYQRFNLEPLFMDFLFSKRIISKQNYKELINIYYFEYDCHYRDIESRDKMIEVVDKVNSLNSSKNGSNITVLNTVYMGHFLQELIENNNM